MHGDQDPTVDEALGFVAVACVCVCVRQRCGRWRNGVVAEELHFASVTQCVHAGDKVMARPQYSTHGTFVIHIHAQVPKTKARSLEPLSECCELDGSR